MNLLKIALCTIAFCAGIVAANAADSSQTVQEMVDKLRKNDSALGQLKGVSKPENGMPQPRPDTPAICPDPTAVDLFKYQVVFERAQGGALNGLEVIHTNVWERGASTAFYVNDLLPGFVPNVRMTYLFDREEMVGGGTCPVERSWSDCVEAFDKPNAGITVRTCTTIVDISALPAWQPSPDSPIKRRLAKELRSEIEADWKGVQEIVVRDFNLSDPEITMFLKQQDGDSYESCALHVLQEPHCDRWHLFGQAPLSSIRNRIFELPYRLK